MTTFLAIFKETTVISFFVTVFFSLMAIKVIGGAFRGVFSEERTQVGAVDIVAAAIFLLAGIASGFFMIFNFSNFAPLWLWPIVAIAIGGLVSMSVRSALGIPLTKSLGYWH